MGSSGPSDTSSDPVAPKQWEIRAALRAFSRAGEHEAKRHPAEQILDAALELVRKTGNLTVKQVIDEAGVALQTFYRHFGSKDELLLAMMEENIGRGAQRMLAAASEVDDPVELLHLLVIMPITSEYDEVGKRMLRWHARERQRLAERFPSAVNEVHQPYRQALLYAIESIEGDGLGSSKDPALDATIIQHVVLAMTHLTHVGGLDEDPHVVGERIWQLIWQGLSNGDGSEG